jgi:hypothetical protein
MLKRTHAQAILVECGAVGDFHALPAATVDALLEHADSLKYRKPKHANGSRGRYFHAYLTRRAGSLTAYAREESARGTYIDGHLRHGTLTASERDGRGRRRSVTATRGVLGDG